MENSDVDGFTARAVAAEEFPQLNSFCVVLAETIYGGGSRLEIQRALSFNAADVERGMNTYCLCTDSGATYYGGVTGWQLDGNQLSLSLTTEAANTLGTGQNILIDVETSRDSLAALDAGLRRVFA
ncbi:MAG: Imm10 family immunity protein [Myxococcota bacterium]